MLNYPKICFSSLSKLPNSAGLNAQRKSLKLFRRRNMIKSTLVETRSKSDPFLRNKMHPSLNVSESLGIPTQASPAVGAISSCNRGYRTHRERLPISKRYRCYIDARKCDVPIASGADLDAKEKKQYLIRTILTLHYQNQKSLLLILYCYCL